MCLTLPESPASETSTGSAPARERPPATRLSDVARPAANVTVTAPSRIAVKVTAARLGRATAVTGAEHVRSLNVPSGFANQPS